MKYKIRLNSPKFKTRMAIDIIGSCLLPFKELADREKDVLAIYIDGYLNLAEDKTLTDKQIFKQLFDYNFTVNASNVLSTKENQVSVNTIRNNITKLIQKGLMTDREINKDFLNLFASIGDNITFVFEIKTN